MTRTAASAISRRIGFVFCPSIKEWARLSGTGACRTLNPRPLGIAACKFPSPNVGRDLSVSSGVVSRAPGYKDTGILGLMQALARQWPNQILKLISPVMLVWIALFIFAHARGADSVLSSLWFKAFAGTYGLLTVLVLITGLYAAFQAPIGRWHIPTLFTGVAFGLLMGLLFVVALPDWGRFILYGSVVALIVMLGASLQSQIIKFRPNPKGLLSWLTFLSALNADLLTAAVERYFGGDRVTAVNADILKDALGSKVRRRPRVRPPKLFSRWAASKLLPTLANAKLRAYLQYVRSGPPRDTTGHRSAYIDALRGASKAGDQYPPTAYVNVVRGEDYYKDFVAVQYWLAYFYNDWANIHEMDWEQVTVYVRFPAAETDCSTAKPTACAFSQHHGGTIVNWAKLWPPDDVDHRCDHPIVFVARGSHANYPRPGRRRPVMPFAGLEFTGREAGLLGRDPERFVDEALGMMTGTKVAPTIITLPDEPRDGIWRRDCRNCDANSCGKKDIHGICERDFRWLNLKGIWGSPGGFFGDAAPKSPPDQTSWKPFSWLEDCAAFESSVGEKFLH